MLKIWLDGQVLFWCAYDKKAFDDEIVCPVDLKSIEIYLQILNPAYRISLGFQKNSSTIADVLSYLLQLIEIWNKLDVPAAPKRLCKLLIALIDILQFDVLHLIYIYKDLKYYNQQPNMSSSDKFEIYFKYLFY